MPPIEVIDDEDDWLARSFGVAVPPTLADFSFTGVLYAGLYRSGITLRSITASSNIWSSRTGELLGEIVDDPDEDMGLGANDTFIDRMRWNVAAGSRHWVMNHSNTDVDGNAAALNFSTWAAGLGANKKGYIAKSATDFVAFDVGHTEFDGRWAAGPVWARWEVPDGTGRRAFLDSIRAGSLFAFVIAD